MNQVPVLFVEQFSSNIQLLVQQKGSRFMKSVGMGSYRGSQASVVDQVGPIDALQVTTRFAPMGRIDAFMDRRWVFPVDYEVPQLVDSFDMLRLIVDVTSSLVQSAVFALGRAQDDQIIQAFHGPARTGTNGANVTTLPSTQVVLVSQGASAPTALTVAKLRQARLILMQNEVDLQADPVYVGVTAKDHDSMLAEAQVISTDFNDKPVLVEGMVTRFLGINFIHSERLLTGIDDLGGTSRALPCYAKSGMHFAQWEGIVTSIDRRVDLSGIPWQAYAKATIGATRTEEKKVVKIWCR